MPILDHGFAFWVNVMMHVCGIRLIAKVGAALRVDVSAAVRVSALVALQLLDLVKDVGGRGIARVLDLQLATLHGDFGELLGQNGYGKERRATDLSVFLRFGAVPSATSQSLLLHHA